MKKIIVFMTLLASSLAMASSGGPGAHSSNRLRKITIQKHSPAVAEAIKQEILSAADRISGDYATVGRPNHCHINSEWMANVSRCRPAVFRYETQSPRGQVSFQRADFIFYPDYVDGEVKGPNQLYSYHLTSFSFDNLCNVSKVILDEPNGKPGLKDRMRLKNDGSSDFKALFNALENFCDIHLN